MFARTASVVRLLLGILGTAPLWLGAVLGTTTYLCRMDGKVRVKCCCPAQAEAPAPHAAIERNSNCCDVRSARFEAPPADFQASRTAIETPALLAVVPLHPPAAWASAALVRDPAARAPPARAPVPLYVQNSSFLI